MYGVSLDSPVDGKEDTLVFSDILGTEPEQYMDGDKSELRAVLDSVLQTIPHLEEKVIRLYFGLDFLTSMTLEEIAKELELHREVVRHMKEKALRRLMGNPMIKEKLEIFIKS